MRGQETRSNNIGHGMPSRLRTSHTVERRQAWHAIIAFWAAQTVERHRVSHDFTAVGMHARSDDVERDMTSPLLDSTHGQMTLGVACHHRLWTAHMVERCRAWHATIAIWQYKKANDVGGSMPSPPLDYMHGQMTSGVV